MRHHARNHRPLVFQRLPQRVKRGPRKLRQLVQKQHAVVRQRNLARNSLSPAADKRRHGSAVVRRTERPSQIQFAPRRQFFVQHARDRLNHRIFQRLTQRQRRQDGNQPFRQHCLSRTRRPRHQKVVSARRSDKHRPFRTLLPLDVGIVNIVNRRARTSLPAGRRPVPCAVLRLLQPCTVLRLLRPPCAVLRHSRAAVILRRPLTSVFSLLCPAAPPLQHAAVRLAVKIIHQLQNMSCRQHRRTPAPRRFRRVGRRADQPAFVGNRPHRRRQNPVDTLNAAVQRQRPHKDIALEPRRVNQPHRAHQPHRYRQIEMCAFFQ